MTDSDSPDRRIIESWGCNAEPWIRAVRAREIESRRLATDQAILDAVLGRNPRSVLDVGCGEGWLTRRLSEAGVETLGVDIVPELIDAAREAGGGHYRVVSYEEIVAGALDVSVDVAVCNFSLIGGSVVDDLVASVPAMLNRGGSLIVQTLHPSIACGELPYVDGWREGSWAGFSDNFVDPAPWYFRTTESWVALLRSAGFEPVETREPMHPESRQPASLILVGNGVT